MRDLNDIVEGNTKATREAIPKEVADGFHVVAKYTGVNFLGYDKYTTRAEADAGATQFSRECYGNVAKIHSPLGALVSQS